MPYFFIIPIFVIYLLLLILAIILLNVFKPKWKPDNSYILWGSVGSILGFIIFNILINLAGIFSVVISDKGELHEILRNIFRFVGVFAVILGPFFASGIGIIGGFAGGVYIIYRKRNKLSV